MPLSLKMTVNVSLCGSIPRSQMSQSYSNKQQLRELDANSNDVRNGCHTKTPSCSKLDDASFGNGSGNGNSPLQSLCLPRQVSCEEMSTSNVIAPSPPPIIEPPAWAVAAKGDARLEPVCESLSIQTPVDLTKKAVYRVGRSQNSDIQLLHCTSSRRHAILFHHPNGSCYVVDCGSAHGTYVNGVRVNTVMQPQLNHPPNNGSSGIILPHKVKKGSLIRFGGPGAPTFILKSFSVGLETLVANLKETKNTSISHNGLEKDETELSSAALVTLNTRLNAIGSSMKTLSSKDLSLSLSSAHIHAKLQPQTQTSTISFLKKRSVVSFDDNDPEPEMQMPPMKKQKSSFMTHSFDPYSSTDVPIVSPSRQQKPTLQFNFESVDRPVVSPTPIEDMNSVMNVCNGVLEGHTKSILKTPLSLPSSSRRNRRVNFCDTPPKVHYPRTVSTDESEQ